LNPYKIIRQLSDRELFFSMTLRAMIKRLLRLFVSRKTMAPTCDKSKTIFYNKWMQLTRSQKFFYLCLAFLIGIVIGEFVHLSFYVYLLSCFFVFLIIALLKSNRFIFVILIVISFGLFWRNLFFPIDSIASISHYNDQTMTFTGLVSAEPDVRIDSQKLTIVVREYQGKVLVKTLQYPEYSYGDLLSIKCKLQTPEQIEDFRYDKFLARDGIYSVCYNPAIKKIASGQGLYVYELIIKLKKGIEKRINSTISEPQAALLGGILLGSRRGLPAKLTDEFNRVGITHIIAISGYNITIIVSVLMVLAKSLYINRKKVLWFIVPSLILFVVLTGMSASVVRATIMGLLVVVAGHVGRKSSPKNILMAAAAVMALLNPRIILWDAGFQLSFLATCGLMFLSPKLKKYFVHVPEKFGLQENFTSTFSAIIMTLPLILFNFKRLSIIAPVANLLVLPTIPLAMLIGFIQIVVACLSQTLGQIVGWFTWAVLAYVVKTVDLLSSFSWSAINMQVGIWGLIVGFVPIIIIISRKSKVVNSSIS